MSVKISCLFNQIAGNIRMEAERQNQIASRLADYTAREAALRGYL
jgi:hypothetical protein